MSPYPPGTGPNDPNAPWNAPDRSHEHRWEGVEDVPIIEDGAAIFHERCVYEEGRRRSGDHWRCDKTRSWRFEYSKLVTPDDVVIELPSIDKWQETSVSEEIQDAVMMVETAYNADDRDGSIKMCDPYRDGGIVTIEYDDYELVYEPEE